MKQIFGVSAFGLKDCIAGPNQVCKEEGFFVSDAVLPESPLGRILTGTEAENERIHSGLSWPREARINLGEPLRRVPISCAWSYLTEAGDRTVRWKAPGGASFPMENILTEHIKGLLREVDEQYRIAREVIVAIPNHLDEFGQDGLLKALGNDGEQDVRLVWRPVAAALAWLDQVQDTFGDVTEVDWMGVVYVGVDGIEFTAFKLRKQEYNGTSFIIPVRERPQEGAGPNGADWVADGLEQIFGLDQRDVGAFWQVFTNFPEAWSALARRTWDTSVLPRAWSRQGGWQGWVPPSNMADTFLHVQVGTSSTISRLFKPSCVQPRLIRRGRGKKWGEYLEDEAKKLTKIYRNGCLRGVVVCGPLAPVEVVKWLSPFLDKLSGGVVQGDAQPRVNSLWLASTCEDPIALGAQIYGKRLSDNQPTYLDTLPQISTLVLERGEYSWIHLVDTEECEGGKEYENEINNKFLISKEYDWVGFYLKKEEIQNDLSDDYVDDYGLSKDFIRPIQNVVKSLGSFEAVLYDDRYDRNAKAKKYFTNYAEFFYNSINKRTPYRYGVVRFPISPLKDTVLDLKVKMRPASGQARVQIVPHESDFLQGRRIFFDYLKMEDVEKLPERKLGWPEIIEMDLSNSPDVFSSDQAIYDYLNCDISRRNYLDILDNAKNEWTKSVAAWDNGTQIWLKKIDQNGKSGSACAQKTVDALAKKIEIDFASLNMRSADPNILEKLIIRGSWLWLSSPLSIVSYLEKYLSNTRPQYGAQWNYFIESASRCFISKYSCDILFNAIYDRVVSHTNNPFPMNSARSIYRILMYRNDGQDSLSNIFVHAFLNEACNIIDNQVSQNNLERLFFQGILLFLVLLRYRKVDENFLNPNDAEYKDIFDRIEKILNKAKDSAVKRNFATSLRISNLMDEIKKYMYYEGTPGIIKIIASEIGDG